MIQILPSFSPSKCVKNKYVKQMSEKYLSVWKRRRRLTHGDHALQMDDVGMIKLAHDACLAQEVPSLLLGKPSF